MKFATEENIYKCHKCGALQGEKDLLSLKLESHVILRCHFCNSDHIKIHTNEPLIGVDKCGTCKDNPTGCLSSFSPLNQL